jgi:hypothetical protein
MRQQTSFLASARQAGEVRSLRDLTPVLGAIAYPWILQAFHAAVTAHEATAAARGIVAGLFLAAAFAPPLIGLAFARRLAAAPSAAAHRVAAQRLAYASVVAPTLFVFSGVVRGMIAPALPELPAWTLLWLGAAAWCWVSSPSPARPDPASGKPAPISRLRIIHGATAAILMAYVLFHLANHLFGLVGPSAHAAVMKAGRTVYRARLVEPVLVALMLFQIATGLRLAWRWSGARGGVHRVFQVASGLYLSVFILGHMNSVFIYARTYLKIDTDWAFATGAPTGLILDPWNIRLLPHYALGVFFVLGHLASGLRQVLLAHRVRPALADRLWAGGLAVSAAVSAVIMLGMCGIRVPVG